MDAAKSAMRRWDGLLGALGAGHAWLALAGQSNAQPLVRLDEAEGMVVTEAGRITVEALEVLARLAEEN